MATTTSTFLATSGAGYEEVMGRWSRRLAEPFIDFCGIADGEDILDAGCGTGSLAFALARRGAVRGIRGIDASPAYVDHAGRQNRDPRIVFSVGDVCALPFDDASFDRVLSLLVLHFVPQTGRALAELRRVARPGGTVAAAVWDARGGFVANRIFFDTAAALDPAAGERRGRNYTRPMTRPGELAVAFAAAGLTDIRETTLAIRMEFASFEDYWTPYLGREGPAAEYVQSLTPEQRDRLRDAIRAAYVDGEPDGPRSFAAIAFAVAARTPG